MAPRLPPSQQEHLRWLVQEVRAGKLAEEFTVFWFHGDDKAEPFIPSYQGTIPSSLTEGILQVLETSHMLVARRNNDVVSYILTGNAYTTVDNNFAPDQPAISSVIFDQRYQSVQYQYNAAGDINTNSVQNKLEFIQLLEKLREEIGRAAQANVIDAEVAVDTDGQAQKAIIESRKEQPDKQRISRYLSTVKDTLTTGGAAASLAKGFLEAGELAQKIF